jgi:phage terminase large subunit-like protein
MPEGYELELEDDEAVLRALRLANPGSWVDVREMLRMLRRGMDEREWKRLCLNSWTSVRDVWLPSVCWTGLKEPEGFEIPAGAPVFVGVDAAWKHDCAAVCWAYPYEQDGRAKVAIRSRIWSNRHDVPHDQYVGGSELRLGLLEDFIAEGLGRRYDVREIVFDPQMFLGEAQRLDDRGFRVAPLHQASAHMVEAVQAFYTACREGTLSHAGDATLAAHVEATAADLTSSGWRIRKLKSSQPIDGCVAAVMAHWRADRYEPQAQQSYYNDHDLFVIGGDDEDDDFVDESEWD